MGKKAINVIGFPASTMTVRGFEPSVGRCGRVFIIFFLDNPTRGKIFS
jgi:hypothetical protein